MGVFPQTQGTSEVVYELAAHVLFSVVDWARKLPTFNNLMESDQITLLKMAWSDLYLLEGARSPIHMYLQQLYATASMQARQVSMENILKRMEHARLFQDQVEKVRSLGMDLTEHFHIKCIILFRTGEVNMIVQLFSERQVLFNIFFTLFFNNIKKVISLFLIKY